MSKIRFLATAALLLGTVALIGADKPARPANCPAACSHCPKNFTKAYAVADLVVPVPGMTGPFPGMAPANCCDEGGCCALLAAYCPPMACYDSNSAKSLEADLMKLITDTVRPASWSDRGGNCTIDYSPVGQALVVNAPAETQDQVQALLERLRKFQDVNLTFEMRFITVPEEFFERFGLDLDMGKRQCPHVIRETKEDGLERVGIDFECCDGERASEPACSNRAVPITDVQAHLLLEAIQGEQRASVMQAPKVTLFNAQRSGISVQDRQTFVTGVTVESVNGQTRVVPKNTTIATGLNVTLLPLLSADRHFVSLSFHADHTYPASAVTPLIPVTTQITPRVEGGFTGKPVPFTHYIQQPKFNTLTCDSHLVIADGGTMLIDAGKLDRNVRCASEVSVPVLARIPYLNRLFKTVSYEPVTEHMLVMVTARVIYPMSECNNKTPADHCKSQGGCGATAACQSGCCTAGCCDKGCCTSGCCKSGCCEKGCCGNCEGKPAKVAAFAEEASAAPAKPAKVIPPAATKSPVELRAEKMAAKLVQKYHEACANGEPEKARRYGRQALDLDPECFGKTMIQESYQRMPQPEDVKPAGLIYQSDDFGPLKRPELKRNELSDRPSHLTPERVHGGIQ